MIKPLKPWIIVIIIAVLTSGYFAVKYFVMSRKDSLFNYAAQQKKIKLFYVNENGKLQAEKREIQGATSVLDDIKICVEELAKGPKGKGLFQALPKETKLREVYLDDNRCVYLDFTKSIINNPKGGTTAEMQLIYSLVNTIFENFGQIASVRLLVEGQEIKTIGGHLDVNRPLRGKKLE
ncbi:MAG: GerMN domain-containing protein [Candidatus Firestonebacteria bacterium]